MTRLSPEVFEQIWEQFDSEAQEAKFSQGAVLRLAEFYRNLDHRDREVVHKVLASWVLEGDERRRFDALALIDEFEIRSAAPVLSARLTKLKEMTGPSIRDDRVRLEQLIAHLTRSQS